MTFNAQPLESAQSASQSSQASSSSASTFPERERCELLSAYLDGEVTAVERQQVEDWLAQDASFREKYDRLLRLRHGLQGLAPQLPNSAADQTVEAVLAQVGQRSERRRFKLTAIAATAIAGLIAGTWLSQTQLPLQMAQNQDPVSEVGPSEPLVISLDQPIIDLPTGLEPETQTSPANASSDNSSPALP
jgi:anti-sigma factor RsiW